MAGASGVSTSSGSSVYIQQLRSVGSNVLVAAVSSSVAGMCTNPIDVIKTEMQMSKASQGDKRPLGMYGTLQARVATRGVLSLWAGIPPMIMRSLFYTGVRLGTYDPVKAALGAKEKPTLWRKILAGIISGSLGAAAANPVEVVKTRIQADPTRYSSTPAAFSNIISTEGLFGSLSPFGGSFAQGLVPHILRGAAVTSSQVAIYDDTKHRLKGYTGLDDGIPLRFISSMVAGVVTTTVSSPFDVVKTRTMIEVGGSVFSATRKLVQEEGLRGFFKGWSANYSRLGPHTVVIFIIYEQIRSWTGLGTI